MEIISSLLSSKKFVAMLAGLIVTLTAKIGWNIDETTITQAVALIGTYIAGQGLADMGKEKAKVEAGS